MPCRYDPSPDEIRAADEARTKREMAPILDKVNTLTKLLCEACTLLSASKVQNARPHSNALELATPELQGWAANHAKADKKRKNDAVNELRELAAKLGYDLNADEIKKNLK